MKIEKIKTGINHAISMSNPFKIAQKINEIIDVLNKLLEHNIPNTDTNGESVAPGFKPVKKGTV